jgi:DNA-binding CsgD family transcriptional regulator
MPLITFPSGLNPPGQRELLQTVTRDRVAGLQIAREFAGITLVACRVDAPDESSLDELDNVEFGTLVLHAEGLDEGQLAMGLGERYGTINKRLSSIYKKLDARDEVEASSHIPVRDTRLMRLPAVGYTARGGKTGVFNEREKQFFDLVASGTRYAAIPRFTDIRPPQIETLFDNICSKLGFGDDLYARGMQLRRAAGALKNLGVFANELNGYANEVQPCVVDVIDSSSASETPSLRSRIVSALSENPQTRSLTPNGHDPYQRVAWEIVYREIDLARKATESS